MAETTRASTKDHDPAPGGVALLVIDMINRLDFAGADEIRRAAVHAGAAVTRLRDQADAAGVPVIYVNDNDDEWHSERSRLVERCAASPNGALTRQLAPRPDDFFVIKPRFSGFYATNLPVLLPRLGVRRLVLTGLAADICVLFTAADAHMREYGLWVPGDAVASNSTQRTRWALDIMETTMGAEIRPSSELSVSDWVQAA